MSSKFDDLVRQSIQLGESFPIMPVDEIRLAVAFAELPNIDQVVERLVTELYDHPNMHVRRIAVNACRRAQAFTVPSLKAALTDKLSDSEAWVVYDAAWAIHSAGYDSPEIRHLLSNIAGVKPLAELQALVAGELGNAHWQAQARARVTLNALIDSNLSSKASGFLT